MENPITYHRRIRHISRRGLVNVAKLGGYPISESAVQQTEYGMFTNIPKNIHKIFSTIDSVIDSDESYNAQEVNRQYKAFIQAKREKIKYESDPFSLKRISIDLIKESPQTHPFTVYLQEQNIAPSSFCQHACVPKSSFFRWIKGNQQDMPIIVRGALVECGISISYVRELDTLGKSYYHNIRERV